MTFTITDMERQVLCSNISPGFISGHTFVSQQQLTQMKHSLLQASILVVCKENDKTYPNPVASLCTYINWLRTGALEAAPHNVPAFT